MTRIYQAFLALAEKMNGAKIEGQFAKDIIWIIAALFGFWFLVMVALFPYYLIKRIFNQR